VSVFSGLVAAPNKMSEIFDMSAPRGASPLLGKNFFNPNFASFVARAGRGARARFQAAKRRQSIATGD
jgi:hypothetical protein